MDPFEIFSQFMESAAGHSHGHSHAGMIPEEEYEDEEEYDEDEDGYGEGAVACCGPGGCCGGDDEEELPFPPFLYQYFPVSRLTKKEFRLFSEYDHFDNSLLITLFT